MNALMLTLKHHLFLELYLETHVHTHTHTHTHTQWQSLSRSLSKNLVIYSQSWIFSFSSFTRPHPPSHPRAHPHAHPNPCPHTPWHINADKTPTLSTISNIWKDLFQGCSCCFSQISVFFHQIRRFSCLVFFLVGKRNGCGHWHPLRLEFSFSGSMEEPGKQIFLISFLLHACHGLPQPLSRPVFLW